MISTDLGSVVTRRILIFKKHLLRIGLLYIAKSRLTALLRVHTLLRGHVRPIVEIEATTLGSH